MKKILILILILGIVVGISSCDLGEKPVVKSDKEARENVENLTESIDAVSSSISNINEALE